MWPESRLHICQVDPTDHGRRCQNANRELALRFNLPGSAQRRLLALVPVLLVVLIGALTYERARAVIGDVSQIERSYEVEEASGVLLTRAIDAETGQRAYLLTGDETFLQPYNGSRTDVGRALQRLRKLAAGDQAETAMLNKIDALLTARFGLLQSEIRDRRSGKGSEAANADAQFAGKRKMDQLRGAVATLQAHERSVLETRHAAERQGVVNASLIIVGAALAALLLSALLNLVFSRAIEERDRANIELERLNEDLERQAEQLETQAVEMESQAAELEATSEDLRSTNDELIRTTREAELSRDAAETTRSQLESVLKNLPDAASVYDADLRLTYANPASKRLFGSLGIDPESVAGKNVWDLLPQLKGTKFEQEVRRAKREGAVIAFEEYRPALDAWFENTVVPSGGSVMTFTRDITRRKREEEGARLLADASRVLASTLDYEKTLQAVARLAVGELADWCAVDLVMPTGGIRQVVISHVDEAKIKWAKELNKRYPPDYDAPTGVGHVIRTGKPEIYPEITDEMLRASARDADHLAITRELQIKSALVVPMIARGRSVGALTLISTARGRRYGEQDLTLAMELATRAAIAIDNAQLYRSALTASEAKSAFLATMSHELRTPLNAIIGYESLLKERIYGPLTEAQVAQLQRIRSSADHLLTLIDEVLTFSRVEAGKEVVHTEEIELRSVIDEAVVMIAPSAQVKGLAVRVEGDGIRLATDSGKVRQIILNLLSNAVKFTDSGEIHVRLDRNDVRAIISVSDTGIGIAPEHLERIFDPFWQVEQRSTRKAGGTGLGLSVSRTLARLVGGEITVESEPGEGTTFTLTLPAARS
jgi:PAS domain S-box-containing protein